MSTSSGLNTAAIYSTFVEKAEWNPDWGYVQDLFVFNFPLHHFHDGATTWGDLTMTSSATILRLMGRIVSEIKVVKEMPSAADGGAGAAAGRDEDTGSSGTSTMRYYQKGSNIPRSVQFIEELIDSVDGALIGYRMWVVILDSNIDAAKSCRDILEDNLSREARARRSAEFRGTAGPLARRAADAHAREFSRRSGSLIGGMTAAPDTNLWSDGQLVNVMANYLGKPIDSKQTYDKLMSADPLKPDGTYSLQHTFGEINAFTINMSGVCDAQRNPENYFPNDGDAASSVDFIRWRAHFPQGVRVYRLMTQFFHPDFLCGMPLPDIARERLHPIHNDVISFSNDLQNAHAARVAAIEASDAFARQRADEDIAIATRWINKTCEEMDALFMSIQSSSPSAALGSAGMSDTMSSAWIDDVVRRRNDFRKMELVSSERYAALRASFSAEAKARRAAKDAYERAMSAGETEDAASRRAASAASTARSVAAGDDPRGAASILNAAAAVVPPPQTGPIRVDGLTFNEAIQSLRAHLLEQFWRTFRTSKNVTSTVDASRSWYQKRIEAMGPPGCWARHFTVARNLGVHENSIIRMMTDFGDSLKIETNFRLMFIALFTALNGFRFSWGLRMNLMITGEGGGGKCLGLDTPVIMHDGKSRMVQDVVVGDLLLGDDGAPRRVLSTTTGREEMVRVRFPSTNDQFTCNRSHILSLKMAASPETFSVPGSDFLRICSWYEMTRETLDGTVDSVQLHTKIFESEKDADVHRLKQMARDCVVTDTDVIDISVANLMDRAKVGTLTFLLMRAVRYRPQSTAFPVTRDMFEIDELPVDDYYGFTLDGNHRFVVGNGGIVTHNSFVVEQIECMTCPGTTFNLMHLTTHALNSGEDMSGTCLVMEEVPLDMLGVDEHGNTKAADPYLKNRLTRGLATTMQLDRSTDEAAGARKARVYVSRVMLSHILITNDRLPRSDTAIMSRFIVYTMEKLARNDVYGEDRTFEINKDSGELGDRVTDVLDGYKLQSFYLLAWESAIEAGVLPDIDTGLANIVFGWIFEELAKRQIPKPARRHRDMAICLCRVMTMYLGISAEFFSEHGHAQRIAIYNDTTSERARVARENSSQSDQHARDNSGLPESSSDDTPISERIKFEPWMMEGLVKWSFVPQSIAVFAISLLEYVWVPEIRTRIARTAGLIAGGKIINGCFIAPKFKISWCRDMSAPEEPSFGSFQQDSGPGPGPGPGATAVDAEDGAAQDAAAAADEPMSGNMDDMYDWRYIALAGSSFKEITEVIRSNMESPPSENDVLRVLDDMRGDMIRCKRKKAIDFDEPTGHVDPTGAPETRRIKIIVDDENSEAELVQCVKFVTLTDRQQPVRSKQRIVCIAIDIIRQDFSNALRDSIRSALTHRFQHPQDFITAFPTRRMVQPIPRNVETSGAWMIDTLYGAGPREETLLQVLNTLHVGVSARTLVIRNPFGRTRNEIGVLLSRSSRKRTPDEVRRIVRSQQPVFAVAANLDDTHCLSFCRKNGVDIGAYGGALGIAYPPRSLDTMAAIRAAYGEQLGINDSYSVEKYPEDWIANIDERREQAWADSQDGSRLLEGGKAAWAAEDVYGDPEDYYCPIDSVYGEDDGAPAGAGAIVPNWRTLGVDTMGDTEAARAADDVIAENQASVIDSNSSAPDAEVLRAAQDSNTERSSKRKMASVESGIVLGAGAGVASASDTNAVASRMVIASMEAAAAMCKRARRM